MSDHTRHEALQSRHPPVNTDRVDGIAIDQAPGRLRRRRTHANLCDRMRLDVLEPGGLQPSTDLCLIVKAEWHRVELRRVRWKERGNRLVGDPRDGVVLESLPYVQEGTPTRLKNPVSFPDAGSHVR